jgi:hypothetical protein
MIHVHFLTLEANMTPIVYGENKKNKKKPFFVVLEILVNFI